MIGDLFINGIDAATHGVSMGSGFVETLQNSITFKDGLENESFVEHGKRVVLNPYYASRDVSLTFVIQGANKTAYEANDAWLVSILKGRKLTIRIKGDSNYYRLVYSGKGVSYAKGTTAGRRTAKFEEVNPYDRASSSVNPLFSQ